MSGSKKQKLLRPEALAWYMAVSACLSSSSRANFLSLKRLMPMLAEEWYS